MSEIHPEVAKIFDFVIVSDAALQYYETNGKLSNFQQSHHCEADLNLSQQHLA